MKKKKKLLFLFLFSFIIIIFSKQTGFSQVYVDTIQNKPIHLTHKEHKLAKKKGLEDIEMCVLLQKGYSFEKIKETQTEELKKTVNLQKTNLSELNKKRNEKLKESEEKVKKLEERIKELEGINKTLEEKIKVLESENGKQ